MTPSSSKIYEVEKFNGRSSFSLWKIRVRSFLVLQRLSKVIDAVFSEEIKESEKPSSSKVEKVKEVKKLNQDDNVDAPVQQQSYNIAIGRENGVINRPRRFTNVVDRNPLRYVNLVKFALSVVENIDVLEPNSYKEDISNSEGQKVIGCNEFSKERKAIKGLKHQDISE
ncbi:hypothetical protein HAX54_026303, partial [Datura stramonium]|nr:hypothetical protein [Datura stramonium]